MSRFTNPVPQFFLDDGNVASYARMYFYENKNFASLKNTYSQPDNTVANPNPMTLTGSGRLMPCFGEGLYSVKLFSVDPETPDVDGTLLWSRDDVDLSDGGDTAFSAWSPVQTYGTGSIVKDGEPYYRLYGSAASKGEQPSATPSKWEKVVFITEHINGRSYPDNYVVIKDGKLYASNVNDNVTTPPSASWDNISFNNSITGDLTVSGTIFGNLDQAYDANGNVSATFLNNGKYTASRYKNTITLGIHVEISSSMTTSVSLFGFLGSDFRPTTQIIRCDGVSASGAMIKLNVDNLGSVSFIRGAGAPVTEYFTFSVVYGKTM